MNFQSTALPTELSGLTHCHPRGRGGSKRGREVFDNRKITLFMISQNALPLHRLAGCQHLLVARLFPISGWASAALGREANSPPHSAIIDWLATAWSEFHRRPNGCENRACPNPIHSLLNCLRCSIAGENNHVSLDWRHDPGPSRSMIFLERLAMTLKTDAPARSGPAVSDL